ncbi:hypothetical protein [Roseomonas sp. WA12]
MTPAEIEERFLKQQAQLNMLYILVGSLVETQPELVIKEVRRMVISVAKQTAPDKPMIGTPGQEVMHGYQHEEALRFLQSLGDLGK